MRLSVLSIALACALSILPASADTFAERLDAFNAALIASPCRTDTECEALAHKHGLDPDILDAMTECENGVDDACALLDDLFDPCPGVPA